MRKMIIGLLISLTPFLGLAEESSVREATNRAANRSFRSSRAGIAIIAAIALIEGGKAYIGSDEETSDVINFSDIEIGDIETTPLEPLEDFGPLVEATE